MVPGTTADAGAADLLLAEDGIPLPDGLAAERFSRGARPHFLSCPCCAPRSGLARALTRAFAARARGERAFFRRVVLVLAPPADIATIVAEIAADPLAAARFRVDAEPGPRTSCGS